MQNTSKKWIKSCIGIVFALLFTAIDQFTKHLAVLHLKNAPAIPILPDIFELSYLENRGAAFGILQGQKYLFLVMTVLAMALLSYLYCRLPEERRYVPMHLILILLISGAAGNFIDRLARGYVVDFFYFELIDFPVFNVADIYVTVSAALLVVLFLFYYSEEDIEMFLGQLVFWKKKETR